MGVSERKKTCSSSSRVLLPSTQRRAYSKKPSGYSSKKPSGYSSKSSYSSRGSKKKQLQQQ